MENLEVSLLNSLKIPNPKRILVKKFAKPSGYLTGTATVI
jgi:hypothetical protein